MLIYKSTQLLNFNAMNNDVHQQHVDAPVSPSSSRPGIVKTAAKRIVALGLSTAAAIGAVGCSTDNGASGAQSCDMAEQAEPVKSSIHKFTYQSEYMFNPVKGIKINLDVDVGGITNKMKQACGGQPQLQLYGTINRDHGGGGNNILKEPGVLLSTKEIVTNGRQHIEVSFDKPQPGSKTPYVIGVEDFEIRITGPGGTPVFQKVAAEPEQHFDSGWGPDTPYDDTP